MRRKKSLSAIETLELLNKTWATTTDIQKLASCGYQTARNIKVSITDKLESEKYYIPPGYVPMEKVKEYLNINISYLKKIASIFERSEINQTQNKEVL